MNVRIGICLGVLLFLVSCARPAVVEEYRLSDDRDSTGRFSFSLDMSDSAAVYDISFYTRFDCPAKVFCAMEDLPVNLELVSPSGCTYGETVYIPVSGFKSLKRGTYDSKVEYRTGLVPVEKGMWEMNIAIPERKGFQGIGVINVIR